MLDGIVARIVEMDVTEMQKKLEAIAEQLLALSKSLQEKLPVFPEESQKLVDQKLCLFCKEAYGNKRIVRGNHEYCYRRTDSKIKAGVLTDNQAVESGLMLPKSAGGRKGSVEFEERIAAAATVIDRSRAASIKYSKTSSPAQKVAEPDAKQSKKHNRKGS